MKKLCIFAVLIGVLLAITAVAHPTGSSQKDIRDKLIQPADAVYREYGYNDDMLPLYNIWANQAVCKNYEIRIETLEKQVEELVKQLAELTAEKIKPGDKERSAPADSETAGAGPVAEITQVDGKIYMVHPDIAPQVLTQSDGVWTIKEVILIDPNEVTE